MEIIMLNWTRGLLDVLVSERECHWPSGQIYWTSTGVAMETSTDKYRCGQVG